VYRREVAKLFGVTPAAISQWEREGKLKSRRVIEKDVNGIERVRVVIDDAEVEAFRATYKPGPKRIRPSRKDRVGGERCAKVFALFAKGHKPWDVVQIARVDVDTVLDLWQKWQLGPEGVIEQKRLDSIMAMSERQWKESRERERKERWLRHREEVSRNRREGPAPIILSRVVGEAIAQPVPSNGARAPKAVVGSAPGSPPDKDQTD